MPACSYGPRPTPYPSTLGMPTDRLDALSTKEILPQPAGGWGVQGRASSFPTRFRMLLAYRPRVRWQWCGHVCTQNYGSVGTGGGAPPPTWDLARCTSVERGGSWRGLQHPWN